MSEVLILRSLRSLRLTPPSGTLFDRGLPSAALPQPNALMSLFPRMHTNLHESRRPMTVVLLKNCICRSPELGYKRIVS